MGDFVNAIPCEKDTFRLTILTLTAIEFAPVDILKILLEPPFFTMNNIQTPPLSSGGWGTPSCRFRIGSSIRRN